MTVEIAGIVEVQALVDTGGECSAHHSQIVPEGDPPAWDKAPLGVLVPPLIQAKSKCTAENRRRHQVPPEHTRAR